jgi:hypothetical protein
VYCGRGRNIFCWSWGLILFLDEDMYRTLVNDSEKMKNVLSTVVKASQRHLNKPPAVFST